MNSTAWIQFVLAAVACGVLLMASFAIVRFGKDLKGPSSGSSGGRRSGPSMAATGLTRDTYHMARKLKEQGVSTAALAGMSAAEQKFFLEMMSARLGEGTGPRLVRRPAGATATAAAPAPEAAPIPAAALVTGPIHCPVCRSVIGQRSEPGPTMQKCPGCSRRVTTKVEGDRLTVTVSYGMGTPAKGSAAIRPR